MSVVVEFADGDHGNALADFNQCQEHADVHQSRILDQLLFDYLEGTLGSMSADQLATYVGTRPAWKIEQDHTVIRNSEAPYVAYTVFERGGAHVVLVLGFCLFFPDSDADSWWTNVLHPRLIEHL